MTPQFSASFLEGDLWGGGPEGNLIEDYAGSALVGGFSIGSISAEVFSTIDNEYGIPNGRVTGVASGVSAGAVPVEGHIFYTNAIYNPGLSYIANKIRDFFGLLNR